MEWWGPRPEPIGPSLKTLQASPEALIPPLFSSPLSLSPPPPSMQEADAARLRFAGDDCCDHFAAVRAFEGFASEVADSSIGSARVRAFCRDSFLSYPALLVWGP